MSLITKIFGKQDYQSNELVNVKVENITTTNVATRTYDNGSFYYNSTEDEYYGVRANAKRIVNTGNNYSKFLIQTSGGDTWVNSTSVHDDFKIEEGRNVSFDVNTVTRKVTINSDAIDYSNNFAQEFGDTSNTAYLIDHNLNSTNVIVQIQETTSNGNIIPWTSNISIISGNQIEINTPNPPGTNAYKAVVSSNMGPQGFQGVQGIQGPQGTLGTTGPQGPQGSFGDNIPGTEYQTTRLDASNTVVSTSVIKTHDKGTSSNVTITANNDSYALIVNSSNVSAQANIGGIYTRIEYNVSSFDSANSRLLSAHTKASDTNNTTEMFNVDGTGRIMSEGLNDNTTGASSQRLTYADNDGKLYDSGIELSTYSDVRKITRTITETEILTGMPIEIVPSPGTGKIVVPHHFVLKFDYVGGQYFFTGTTGIVIDSVNTNSPSFIFNNGLISGTNGGYQTGSVNFVDDATHAYITENKGMYYKPLGGTPSKTGSTVGDFIVTIYYSILDA